MGRPLPEDAVLAAAYRAGTSATKLAAEYRVGPSTVLKILRREGVPIRPARPPVIALDVAKLVEEYRAGDTMVAIARRYNVATKTVRQRLAAAGVLVPRPPARVPAPSARKQRLARMKPDEQIIAAYQRGATLSEVAADNGVDISTVRRRLIAAGVAIRPGGRILQPAPEHVAELYGKGATVEDLAEMYQVSSVVIRDRLTRAGVLVRYRRPPRPTWR